MVLVGHESTLSVLLARVAGVRRGLGVEPPPYPSTPPLAAGFSVCLWRVPPAMGQVCKSLVVGVWGQCWKRALAMVIARWRLVLVSDWAAA